MATHPSRLTRALAGLGEALVALPLLAPVVFGLMVAMRSGQWHFDYLLPAELFPMVLAGGAVLGWAAWRLHAHRALIAGALVAAVVFVWQSRPGGAHRPGRWFHPPGRLALGSRAHRFGLVCAGGGGAGGGRRFADTPSVAANGTVRLPHGCVVSLFGWGGRG